MACRAARIVGAVLFALMTGMVGGCGGGDGPPTQAAESAPQPSDSAAVAANPSEDSPPTVGPTHPACLAAERRSIGSIWLTEAGWELVDSPSGTSAKAARTVVRNTARVEQRLRKRCGGEMPTAFQEFSSDVKSSAAAESFTHAQLDQVFTAWLGWGEAVGAAKPARRAIREFEFCRREFLPTFHASYRVWWKPTDTGKVWWVELTFDNQTGQVLDGSTHGTVDVSKMLEDPFGWEKGPKPGPGKDSIEGWGGSSSDFLELHPGRTVERAVPGIDEDVHTTADGTLRVVDVHVSLNPRGERYSCSPPVHAAP